MTTVFGKIIEGSLPSEKVYEDEQFIAIKDITPLAPVHLLIIPKKEYRDLNAIPPEEQGLFGEVVSIAQRLSKEYGIEDNYRLITNIGSEAGQTVFHLHFHVIGGKKLGAMV